MEEPIVNDPVSDTADAPADAGASAPSTPSGQDGTLAPAATPQDQETVANLREQLRATQRQLVDGRQTGNPGESGIDLTTPEGQYMVALELGTSRLRSELESIFPLYAEIPAEEIARVRANPWAFVSPEVHASANWKTAKWQVEEALAKRADQLAKSAAPVKPAVTPATISNNPAPAMDAEPAAPGSEEDQDPWTMPMAQLEKAAMKAKAKLSTTK